MRAFSLDSRTRVLAEYPAGLSFAELGRKDTTRAEWVRPFIRRYDATGKSGARPSSHHRVPFYRRHETERRQAVAENPSLPLEGLRATVGVACDRTTIWERLARFDDFRQKNRSSPPSNSGPPPPPAKSSARCNTPASTPTASSSSTKPGSKPTGPGVTVGGRAASVSSNMSRTATG